MSKIITNSKTKDLVDFNYVLNSIELITPFGIDKKKKIKPFLPNDEACLIHELHLLEEIICFVKNNSKVVSEIKTAMMNLKEITNSIMKAEKDVLSIVELFEIKNTLLAFEKIHRLVSCGALPGEYVICDTVKLLNLIDPTKDRLNTFYIYDIFSERLKELRIKKREIERLIRDEKKIVRDDIKTRVGIHLSAKFEFVALKSNVAEVNLAKRLEELEEIEQDVTSVVFAIKDTPEQKKQKYEIEKINCKIEIEEEKVRELLSKEIWENSDTLISNLGKIGELDFVIGKAEFAILNNCTKPEIINEHRINIKEGRNLKLEHILKEKKKKYVPISIMLEEGVTCISGANMGGKSVTLKLVGMMVLLAQYGFFVPAKKLEIGLSSFIQVLIGDNQSMERGLSSFGSEMEEFKEILDNCKEKSIILIDEIASGTNPIEGNAITRGIADYLSEKNSITIITTHYEVEIKKRIKKLQVVGLKNMETELLEREIKYSSRKQKIEIVEKYMDYNLVEINDFSEQPRDALNIARILGVNKEIIEKAKKHM